MLFSKNLENKKKILSGECYLPFFIFCFVSNAEVSLAGNKNEFQGQQVICTQIILKKY